MEDPIRQEYITDNVTAFRERFGDTGPLIYDKSAPYLSEPMQRFVTLSPFCVVSSQDACAATDISPRGDPAGFVAIVTPTLLLIPDRP